MGLEEDSNGDEPSFRESNFFWPAMILSGFLPALFFVLYGADGLRNGVRGYEELIGGEGFRNIVIGGLLWLSIWGCCLYRSYNFHWISAVILGIATAPLMGVANLLMAFAGCTVFLEKFPV